MSELNPSGSSYDLGHLGQAERATTFHFRYIARRRWSCITGLGSSFCSIHSPLPLALLNTLILQITMAPSVPSFYAVVLFALFARFTAGVLIFTGQTLFLDGIPYYVPATPITTVASLTGLKLVGTAGGLVPVTVVGTSATNSSLAALESIIEGFYADDVWNAGFLKGKDTPAWSTFCFVQPGSAPHPQNLTPWVALMASSILERFVLLPNLSLHLHVPLRRNEVCVRFQSSFQIIYLRLLSSMLAYSI